MSIICGVCMCAHMHTHRIFILTLVIQIVKVYLPLSQLACRFYAVEKTTLTSPDITRLGDVSALFTWTASVKCYLRAGHALSCYVLVWEMRVKT